MRYQPAGEHEKTPAVQRKASHNRRINSIYFMVMLYCEFRGQTEIP